MIRFKIFAKRVLRMSNRKKYNLLGLIVFIFFAFLSCKEKDTVPQSAVTTTNVEKHGKNTDIHCNYSFDPETWDSCNYTKFVYDEFDIKILDYDELPYITKSKSINKRTVLDDNQVPMRAKHGKMNYHPVLIAQYAIRLVDAYSVKKDKALLKQFENITKKSIGCAMEKDSTMFFTYMFDFPLHGCEEETMLAPWYSGMAQGQFLSAYIRMYEQTNDPAYLSISKEILRSYTLLKGDGHDPWMSCVDKNGNLWFEEYPRDLPSFTLNGMIFAIYGLYDFYRITKDEEALKLLNASLTTIKVNIHKFRNVEDVSWYCLKHHNYNGKNPSYHKVHIDQLNMLFKMTGDAFFKTMADTFFNDTKIKKEKEEAALKEKAALKEQKRLQESTK